MDIDTTGDLALNPDADPSGDDGAVHPARQALAIFLVVAVLAFAAWAFFHYGRQHRIILDNRAVELPDGESLRALQEVAVSINRPLDLDDDASDVGSDSEEAAGSSPAQPSSPPLLSYAFWPAPDASTADTMHMTPRERLLIKVTGPTLTLRAIAYDRRGNPTGPIEKQVHIGSQKDGMIRLVKLFNDRPDYFEDYPNDAVQRPVAEDVPVVAPDDAGMGEPGVVPIPSE